MSTLKDTDPAADRILDFIAGGAPGNSAGESAGNYNAVYGNARSTNDLSKFTVAEILEQQRLSRAERGVISTAIGRYQLIRATLLGLVTIEDEKQKFTPELQDKLALALLNRRGYSRWLKGELSTEDFAHQLSCEWASLPDPKNDGRSHYDGVSGNHASTTLMSFYTMLEDAEVMATTPEEGLDGIIRRVEDLLAALNFLRRQAQKYVAPTHE